MSFAKIANILLVCMLSAVAILWGCELIAYVTTSSQYPVGTEIGSWRYRTSIHYVGSLIAVVVAALGGVGLGAVVKNAKKRAMIRGGFAVLLLGDMLNGYLSFHGM